MPNSLAVAVEQLDLLGADEQALADRDRLAGRHGHPRAQVVDLVAVLAVGQMVPEGGADLALLIGDQRGQPVLVGDAEPAALARQLDVAVVAQIVVVDLLKLAAEHADRALVQDVEAERRGRAPAADQAVGLQRDRLVAGVLDPLHHGQEVVLVDRDLAQEAQARAIVPAQRDRLARPELGAVGLPLRVRTRHRDLRIGGDPAELDEVGVRRARRAEQGDVLGDRAPW